MKTKFYNKLVRDQIPDIIKSNGGVPVFRSLDSDEFSLCLREKLLEEVQEFISSNEIEELADILEVFLSILDEYKLSFEQIEKIRQIKSQKNGSFNEKLFLVSVME